MGDYSHCLACLNKQIFGAICKEGVADSEILVDLWSTWSTEPVYTMGCFKVSLDRIQDIFGLFFTNSGVMKMTLNGYIPSPYLGLEGIGQWALVWVYTEIYILKLSKSQNSSWVACKERYLHIAVCQGSKNFQLYPFYMLYDYMICNLNLLKSENSCWGPGKKHIRMSVSVYEVRIFEIIGS